jgi:uncharacterized phage-associated protein
MAEVFDVARYITEKTGAVSAMKLQKLMYYAQAWSLVWDEEPLFEEDFQAWANGPVLRRLYDRHSGRFKVDSDLFKDGNTTNLTAEQRANIDKVVLSFYGEKSAHWLSNLTHMEAPWLNARKGLPVGAPSTEVITKAAMAEYYDSL